MKHLARFIPLVLVAALLVVLAVRLLSGVDPKHVQTPQVGRDFPALSLQVLGSKTQQNMRAVFNQKPTLVNVFASWCAACHVEHAVLLTLAQQKNWQIVGVAYKDAPADTKRYLKKLGNPYDLVVSDPNGILGIELGLTGVPETFGVTRSGVIKTHLAGPFADMAQLKPLLFTEGQ